MRKKEKWLMINSGFITGITGQAVGLLPDRFTRSGKNPKPNLGVLGDFAVQSISALIFSMYYVRYSMFSFKPLTRNQKPKTSLFHAQHEPPQDVHSNYHVYCREWTLRTGDQCC
jgi:hypothetical protein